MGVLKGLLRIFSYLFGGVLSLFALAISVMSVRSGEELNLGFLPWTGKPLSYWVLGLALLGLVTLVMALRGSVRALYFLWNLGVLVLLVKGLFLSGYRFLGGGVNFKAGILLILAVLLATLGSIPWPQKPGPVRRPQRY